MKEQPPAHTTPKSWELCTSSFSNPGPLYYPPTGCLSHKDFEELGNWTVGKSSDGLGIAPSGVAELFEMGQRTRQRFPRLFNSMTHQSQVEVRCTAFERAKANSANFLHGLFGLKGRSYFSHIMALFIDQN